MHAVCCAALAACAITAPCAAHVAGLPLDPDQHAGGHDHHAHAPGQAPQPLGFDLTRGWLEPWTHTHFTPRGTPLVHAFSLEPAFLDRGLIVGFRHTNGIDEDETELEAELEWAFTRRIGLVVEAPLVSLNPLGGDRETGPGDVAVAPRLLLVETDRFLASLNAELAFPSGDEDRGLGSGEVGVAPSLSVWADLGHWLTLHAQAGVETGLESGESEIFWKGALIYSFLTPGRSGGRDPHGGEHFAAGMMSLILEMQGAVALSGDEDGRHSAQALLGVSYDLTESWEVRGGYIVPIGGHQEFDDAFTLGVIVHF